MCYISYTFNKECFTCLALFYKLHSFIIYLPEDSHVDLDYSDSIVLFGEDAGKMQFSGRVKQQ